MKPMAGRVDDFLFISSGRIISPKALGATSVITQRGIGGYVIIQERRNKLLQMIGKEMTVFVKETA
jgi:hypothetical protein